MICWCCCCITITGVAGDAGGGGGGGGGSGSSDISSSSTGVGGGSGSGSGDGSSSGAAGGSGSSAPEGAVVKLIISGVSITSSAGSAVPITRQLLSTISADITFRSAARHLSAPLLTTAGSSNTVLQPTTAPFEYIISVDPSEPPALQSDTIRISLLTTSVFPGTSDPTNATTELSAELLAINQYYNAGRGPYPQPDALHPDSIELIPCVVQSPQLTLSLVTTVVDMITGTVSTDVPTPYSLTVQLEFNPYVCASVNPIYRGTTQLVRWATSKFAIPTASSSSSSSSSSSAYVKLWLLRENDPNFRLALTSAGGSIPNSGVYMWAVPADLDDAMPSLPGGTPNWIGRSSFTDLFISIVAALPPNTITPSPQQIAAAAANTMARSQRFTVMGPIPDATRGVEETVGIEARTVGAFTSIAGGTEGSNYRVKLSFGSNDYRESKIIYEGIRQPEAPPVLYHIHLSGNNNGVAAPTLIAYCWNTPDTSVITTPTFLGSRTRLDIRSGFVNLVGGGQLSLDLSVYGGRMRFDIEWSKIVYSPTASAMWTLDPRPTTAGGGSGEQVITIRWIEQMFMDPVDYDLGIQPQTIPVTVSIRHLTRKDVRVVLGRNVPNTGTLTFQTYTAQGVPTLPFLQDSNQYYIWIETPYRRMPTAGLNITARSDAFVIRSPNACRVPASPCAPGNSTCTQGQMWGFSCKCNAGYTAVPDAQTACLDVNECVVGKGGSGTRACDPLVTCRNTPGGYECGPCPTGTAGSPYGCQSYLTSAPCRDFRCMSNGHCELIDYDEDAEHGAGGQSFTGGGEGRGAVKLQGTRPKCVCDDGWTLDDDEETCAVSSSRSSSSSSSDGPGAAASYYLIGSGALMVFTLGTFGVYYCVWKRREVLNARRDAAARARLSRQQEILALLAARRAERAAAGAAAATTGTGSAGSGVVPTTPTTNAPAAAAATTTAVGSFEGGIALATFGADIGPTVSASSCSMLTAPTAAPLPIAGSPALESSNELSFRFAPPSLPPLPPPPAPPAAAAAAASPVLPEAPDSNHNHSSSNGNSNSSSHTTTTTTTITPSGIMFQLLDQPPIALDVML